MIRVLERPGGLCFAPAAPILYVVDSAHPRAIHVYEVDDGRVGADRRFADMTPGSSDGIRCDGGAATCGRPPARVATATTGVHVLAPDGTLIGQVVLPESCANLCFGGAAADRLFMAASRSIYALYVNATGA